MVVRERSKRASEVDKNEKSVKGVQEHLDAVNLLEGEASSA
jgi:hypothetical protein